MDYSAAGTEHSRLALKYRVTRGPSVHADEPVVLADPGDWGARDLGEVLPGLERSLPILRPERLRALISAAASKPHARLELLAALAAALQNRHGARIADFGVTTRNAPLAFSGYQDPAVCTVAFSLAAAAISSGSDSRGAQLAGALEQLRLLCEQRHFANLTRAAVPHVRRSGLPLREMPPGSRVFQIGQGARSMFFFRGVVDEDSAVGIYAVDNKRISTRLIQRLGFPHTRQRLVQTREAAVAAARQVGFPCVLKPINGSQGRGVSLDVQSAEMAAGAFDRARRHATAVLIESQVQGSDYRLLVADGRLIAAARRDPPFVKGDGRSTLRELVLAENERRRSLDCEDEARPSPILFDDEVEHCARRQGLGLETVVPAGRQVRARGPANVHGGGLSVDVFGSEHADVRKMAESIARTVGLRMLGIDYITPDITRSWHDVASAIVELNQSPGIDVHYLSGADMQPILDAYLAPIFMPGRAGRIPIWVVLDDARGLAGDAVADAVRTRFGARGLGRILTSTTSIDDVVLALAGQPLHDKVDAVLGNRTCERLVICCSPEQVAEQGFPVDRCDVVALRKGLSLDEDVRALCARCSSAQIEVEPEGRGAEAVAAALSDIKLEEAC